MQVTEIAERYTPFQWFFDSGTYAPAIDTHLEEVIPALRAANPDVVVQVCFSMPLALIATHNELPPMRVPRFGTAACGATSSRRTTTLKLKSTRSWGYRTCVPETRGR